MYFLFKYTRSGPYEASLTVEEFFIFIYVVITQEKTAELFSKSIISFFPNWVKSPSGNSVSPHQR